MKDRTFPKLEPMLLSRQPPNPRMKLTIGSVAPNGAPPPLAAYSSVRWAGRSRHAADDDHSSLVMFARS
ncbi:MAG: hypothetical protein K1X53_01275, partial [Candidatus Sumerlaeaceae bacterium]|nr:hypothetical protein [Candidatus Sumerlaeaceae bacterium]